MRTLLIYWRSCRQKASFFAFDMNVTLLASGSRLRSARRKTLHATLVEFAILAKEMGCACVFLPLVLDC
jgi:hypothetical protein